VQLDPELLVHGAKSTAGSTTLTVLDPPRTLVVRHDLLLHPGFSDAARGGERGPRNVREVHDAFGASLAYTTLMTTLDRLYKKGLLARRKEKRAFFYAARLSREQLQRGLATGVLESLLGLDLEAARPVLSTLVETVSQRDGTLLEELEKLVAEKRRQLGEGR
jgi:predicted transcriptional regulator